MGLFQIARIIRDSQSRTERMCPQPSDLLVDVVDLILAGACIVRTVLRKLGKDELIVSDRGLRHGVLEHKFAPAPRFSN